MKIIENGDEYIYLKFLGNTKVEKKDHLLSVNVSVEKYIG